MGAWQSVTRHNPRSVPPAKGEGGQARPSAGGGPVWDTPAPASPRRERHSTAPARPAAAATLRLRGRDFPSPDLLAADRARALQLTPVSRETAERLDRLVALLLERQRTTNLIASSTIPQVWTRHVADSLQLLD